MNVCRRDQLYRSRCRAGTCSPCSRCVMNCPTLMRSLQRSSSTSMHSKAALRSSSPSSILCLKGPKSTSLHAHTKLMHFMCFQSMLMWIMLHVPEQVLPVPPWAPKQQCRHYTRRLLDRTPKAAMQSGCGRCQDWHCKKEKGLVLSKPHPQPCVLCKLSSYLMSEQASPWALSIDALASRQQTNLP